MTFSIERLGNRNRSSHSFPVSPFRLFEDFFNDWALRSAESKSSNEWTPPADIFEKEGNIHLMVSLPGMSEKEISLKVEGQTLTVEGERKSPDPNEYIYHRKESLFGNFSRSFTLPETADMNAIKADYSNGILTITVPQKPELKTKTIKVNS